MQAGNDLTADETAMSTDAAALQSAVQAGQGNLPPSCVPGLRADISAALTAYGTDAIDADAAVSSLAAGNDSLAAGDIGAGNTAVGNGNARLQAATNDITAYNSPAPAGS